MAKSIIFCYFLLLITCTCFGANYDFLALSVQWPNGVCATQKCTIKPPSFFCIHGLWPSNITNSQPEMCSTLKFPSQTDITQKWKPDTVKKMEDYWISLTNSNYSFWEHEWTKHGTCTKDGNNVALSPEEYCTRTMYAYLKYKVNDLVDELDTAKRSVPIKPGNEYDYATLESAFDDVFDIKTSSDQYIDLKCATKAKTQHLKEVLIYMDNNSYNPYIFKSKNPGCNQAMKITFTG